MPDNEKLAEHSSPNQAKVHGSSSLDKSSGSSGPSTPHHEPEHSRSDAHPLLKKDPLLTYGELVILGYNGSLLQGEKGRRRSKFVLCKRPVSNGVRKSQHYVVKTPQSSKAILDSKQHSISYTLSRNQAVIVEYMPDDETDMFQIGRSSESPIDFVVMDTIPGDKTGEGKVTQSTISRFACRILIQRNLNFTARVYAAGFDSSRNIFLGEKATKWQHNGEIDGLTTNGILIMHPRGSFCGGSQPGIWREVSVGGGVYALRESRSAPQKGMKIEDETNVLQDGTLIDLCGATLLWRSAEGLSKSPTKRLLEEKIDELNAGRPQCPKYYFKKSELLVSLGQYEEAIITYLICLTFDSNTVCAKEKATKLFHNLLLRYLSLNKHCSKHNCLDLHIFQNKSLEQQKSLNGSSGSLSSAESNDSLSAVCDESESSSDEEGIKNYDILNRRANTEENKIHMIVENFYHEVEKISDSQRITYRVDASCLDKLDFECPLCMRILWEPVSTPCGHTFCRVCLNRCFDHKPTCPLCKTSLASILAERVQSSTEFLELAIKYLLPEDYAERKSIYEEEMAELSNAGKDLKHVIPLFVCTIAYPTVPCPLHVFEPRYRLMIRQCMESGSRQFGMCAYIDNCIADYGTMLEIRDVQYFPDGRSVVDTVGSRRFRIIEKGERDGYHTGAVEYLQDDAFGQVEDVREIHDRVLKLSQAWFTRLPNDTKQRILQHFGLMPGVESNYLASPNGPSWFWWMLAILPLDPRSQLMILSMTSLPRRLDTLHRVLLHLQSNNVM